MKTTILMGAGAMIPFGGPTTKDLTNILSSHHYCQIVLDKLNNKNSAKTNFESILSNFEQLLELKIAKEYHKDEITSLELLKPSIDYSQTSTVELIKTYYDSINAIIERVKQYAFYPPYEEEIIIKRQRLLRFFKSLSNDQLKIYTLNYDRLIPKIFKRQKCIYDGTNFGVYEYDLEKFIKHPLTYFNLHGSIHLDYSNDGILRISEIPTDLSHSHSIHGGNTGELKIFSPIIAGYNKSQRILSEPFNFGIGAFMYDCNTCDRLIVIGYSFGDPYINNILKNFLNKNTTDISIIDYKFPASLPVNIPIHEMNLIQKSFLEQKEGVFYSSSQHAHLYLNGFYNYINDFLSKQDN